MNYKYLYKTPEGFSDMIMNSDGENLTALCFKNARDILKLKSDAEEKLIPIFKDTVRWLDCYFGGGIPDFIPKYKIEKLTPFRTQVLNIMFGIPYGKTVTYNEIAKEIASAQKREKMSAQAVGGAVGFNPICIIIPCHRVVGAGGNLTGYGGGIQNKIKLLEHEGHNIDKFSLPKGD